MIQDSKDPIYDLLTIVESNEPNESETLNENNFMIKPLLGFDDEAKEAHDANKEILTTLNNIENSEEMQCTVMKISNGMD